MKGEKAMYRDIETGKTVTIDELRSEYRQMIAMGIIEESEQSFDWYIYNCQVSRGGTLEKMF